MRVAARGTTVLAATAAVALGSATAADAATTAYHGSDRAQATAYALRAYDGESDGNGVYADAYLTNGVHVAVWDGNGADGNWGPWVGTNPRIYKFRVCEDHVGCSGWYYYPS